MKNNLCLIILLFIGINIFSQKKKLPEGWNRITLKGKTVYMNLVTGSLSKRYPKKPALEPLEENDFDPTIIHKVKKGESISKIAIKYSLKIEKLQGLNRRMDLSKMKIGKDIIIGYAHNEEEKNAFLNGDISVLHHNHGDEEYEVKKNRIAYKYHVVLFKETLYRIASNYKLSVAKLKELNNLKKNAIFTGQKLRIK